jgi:hypothetical protein
MNELVVHHKYTFGSTLDVSGKNNHGVPAVVAAGSAPFAHALRFSGPDSRVTVLPSSSLQDPVAVAAFVRFYLDDATLGRRYNLVEGHLSFALYVEPGGKLTGTVLDANGTWTGSSTSSGVVTANRWHEAWLMHDGISILELQLNGGTVASSFSVPGPVRSVGPFGIAIGNWPDAGAYPFAGYISDMRFYRYDLEREVRGLLDPCCFDGAAMDRIVRKLREAGHLEALHKSPLELLRILIRLTGLLRGPNSRRARRILQLSQAAFGALQRRDSHALRTFHDLFQDESRQSADREEIEGLQKEFAALFESSGLSEDLLRELAKAACLPIPAEPHRESDKK